MDRKSCLGLSWVGVLVSSGLAFLSWKIAPLAIALIVSNLVGLIAYISEQDGR